MTRTPRKWGEVGTAGRSRSAHVTSPLSDVRKRYMHCLSACLKGTFEERERERENSFSNESQ